MVALPYRCVRLIHVGSSDVFDPSVQWLVIDTAVELARGFGNNRFTLHTHVFIGPVIIVVILITVVTIVTAFTPVPDLSWWTVPFFALWGLSGHNRVEARKNQQHQYRGADAVRRSEERRVGSG